MVGQHFATRTGVIGELNIGVNILSLAAGPHPRRVLTMILALGWPQALIPPAPMAATISYGPSREPGVSAKLLRLYGP